MENISPYALLQASRPKHPPTVVTTYDLYSAVQSRASEADSPSAKIAEQASVSAPALHRNPMPYIPHRTHYIKDIHARHNQISKHTIPGSRLL